MGTSGSNSSLRPLIIGALLGLVVGLVIGLAWAWLVQPAYYAGGAYPNELSEFYQLQYVQSVSEAYLTTRDSAAAARRLDKFSPADKVKWLATVANEFSAQGRATEASMVGDLAAALMTTEDWPAEAVTDGLVAANASPDFAAKLGQVPQAPAAQPQAQATPQTPAEGEGGASPLRLVVIVLIIVLALLLAFFLLSRLRKPSKRPSRPLPTEVVQEDGVNLTPLRQWVGTYTFGQDNYDESFTIETPESDFLGECGMGIMEGFASGSPRRVLAFDVWLFDKTDIRTLSTAVMSKFAFEDEKLRAKLAPDVTPVLATEGATFDIETTALLVKARIEEVTYGEGPPEMSYFNTLKISLSAYLRPNVDVSGDMPIPEGYA